MKPALLAAALLLPLVGTAAGIAANQIALSGASEWRIPVRGYDPRDPLRGRYAAFTYDWRLSGDPADCTGSSCQICLEGPPPDGSTAVVQPDGAACAFPVRLAEGDFAVQYDRPLGGQRAAVAVSVPARVYLDERRAGAVDRMLREQPMVATVRLTRGGRLVAEDIVPAR
ncbi:GDYXXLXY domain-containing protein [Pacificimonas flava]|uniref:GDYXXLXY protein n=1 Tax=Pacificimonas flava TaxID=1234595 RepID=M2U425_9SPHN|nr:GDYXXLXY domain-containing protein [Pacificimonas flava]EMD82728.1 hypothetical protein C725_1768 [Pacificimonas flava]MBB5279347.1 hypothetical protein [Pacificimonas flava]